MENNNFFEDYQALMSSFEKLKKSEANPFFKSKYVPLNAILPVVKEKCAEHNFILYQYPENTNEGINVLTTVIEHKSERIIMGRVEIVSKDKDDPQKLGAGITYMRRYSLTTMFALEDEDDDGQTASQPYKPAYKTPTQQNAKNLLWVKIKKETGDNPTDEQILKVISDKTGVQLKSKDELTEIKSKAILELWN